MLILVHCIRCSKPLDENSFNTGKLSTCRSCGAPTRVELFPAFYRNPIRGNTADPVVMDQEAGCYYHPRKRAVIPCSRCGRFLCALCDVEVNGEHVCFPCLETGKANNRIGGLEKSRFLYDSMALSLSLIPMLFIYITIVTAPIAIFMVFRYWKKPLSIVPRTKIRYIAAFFIAVVQIVAWAVVISNIESFF